MNVIETDFKWALPLLNRSLTTHCIIHHATASGETVEQIHAYHQSEGWAGIGYHFYIRKDGTIYRGRPIDVTGAHTFNMNYCSIGVCFEGNFMFDDMGAEQIAAGQWLMAYIRSMYPNIIFGRHSDFNATECCGTNLPFDEIVNVIEPTHSPETIPQWKVDFYNKAIAMGKITDTSWLQKLDEPAPVWLVLALATR